MSGYVSAWRPTIVPASLPGSVSRATAALAVAGVASGLALVTGLAVAVGVGFTLAPVPVTVASADSSGAVASSGASSLAFVEPVSDGAPADDATLVELRREVGGLERQIAMMAPRRSYIVIDRYNNRLWLRRGSEVRLEALISTGSGTILKESGGAQRVWTFDTPPGRFEVLSERRNPVWTKPDWAFLEEGQQPPRSLAERREKGSLGEWALDLGDGYMIHGTLYERLLGRNTTHGCVRVGREDLRVVAEAAVPGTPVFIF